MTTIAVMTHPYGSEEVAGFEALVGDVFATAEQAPGFVARAEPLDDRDELSNFERDWGRWGTFCAPRFYRGGRTSVRQPLRSCLPGRMRVNFHIGGLEE
jgi:hypothetical protein